MDKITLKVEKDGSTVITEGKDTLVGKLLASKGKIRINSPRVKQEIKIKP